jgi:hypothetical protein
MGDISSDSCELVVVEVMRKHLVIREIWQLKITVKLFCVALFAAYVLLISCLAYPSTLKIELYIPPKRRLTSIEVNSDVLLFI